MNLLNRSLVLLRPRQPFLEWAELDDAEGLALDVFECMREDPPSFLVPPCVHFGSARILIAETWPSRRTLEMFREWFEVTVSSAGEDTVKGVEILEE